MDGYGVFSVPSRLQSHAILRGWTDVGTVLSQVDHDLNERLDYLVHATTRMLNCDRCSVLVREGDFFGSGRGFGYPRNPDGVFVNHKVPIDAPMVLLARQQGGLLIENDARNHPVLGKMAHRLQIDSIVIVPMDDSDGSPVGLMTADFTERIVPFSPLDAEIVASAAMLARGAILADRVRRKRTRAFEMRQQMLERLAEVEERERRRIGQDLHDDVLQRVSSLSHFLETLADESTDAHRAEQLDRLQSQARDAANELRGFVTDLVPVGSDQTSLRSILAGLVRSADRSAGVSVSLHELRRGNPPPTVIAALQRIARQALDNAVAHAQASTIKVVIDTDRDGTRLQVFDDGIGFRTNQVENGVGLFAMTERARQMGGVCGVQSTPESGTLVNVWIPLEHPRQLDEP